MSNLDDRAEWIAATKALIAESQKEMQQLTKTRDGLNKAIENKQHLIETFEAKLRDLEEPTDA